MKTSVLHSDNRSFGLSDDLTTVPMLLILAMVGSLTALMEANLAVLFFYGFWFLIGILTIKIAFPKANRYRSLRIFVLFFLIYYLYMYVTNYLFVVDPLVDYFRAPDSRTFYGRINSVLERSTSLRMVDQVLYEARHWPAFGIIMWLTGKVAYLIDVNSIVIQKMQLVFIASMIAVFLYNMSRIYFDESKAWTIAITYGLLTHLFFFSAVFIRDLHISLIYIVGFYILLRKKNVGNLLILALLCFLAWTFRIQHGIFFLSFIGIYLFLYLRKNRRNLAFFILGLTIFLGAASSLAFYLGGLYENITREVTSHQESQVKKLEGASGVGALLSQLPPGVQHGASVVLSQISPFPFYTGFYSSVLGQYRLWFFPLCIAAIYWIVVWGFVWYGLIKPKLRKAIPVEVKSILLIALMLVLAAGSTSPEARRIMCVYPALYLFASMIFYTISGRKRKFIIASVMAGYGALFIFYVGLKFL